MILFISHYAGRTGAPIALLHILKWLKANSNLRFEILLKTSGELESEFCSVAKTYVLKERTTFSLPSNRRHCTAESITAKKLLKKDYNLIYSNTITNGDILDKISQTKIPLITHCHEMDFWMNHVPRSDLEVTLKRSQHFIACSEPSASCLVKRGVRRDLIDIVPEPFLPRPTQIRSSKELRRELGIPRDSFVVISGGEEGWRKGKDLFIQLAVLLNTSKSQRFDFIWIGQNTNDEFHYWLHSTAEYGRAREYIHMPGLVSNPEEFLGLADIFVMLSREDPMPLIAIEAGSLGLPVICFEGAGGTEDWVRKSGGGRVVDYLEVSKAAELINIYSTHPELLETDGQRAKDYCLDRFTVDTVGSMIHHIIDHFIESPQIQFIRPQITQTLPNPDL